MNSKHLIKLLESNHWFEVRQRGSHKIFKHKVISETLCVPVHGTKDLGKGLVNDILKSAGLK